MMDEKLLKRRCGSCGQGLVPKNGIINYPMPLTKYDNVVWCKKRKMLKTKTSELPCWEPRNR
jgi:hypothetical protein